MFGRKWPLFEMLNERGSYSCPEPYVCSKSSYANLSEGEHKWLKGIPNPYEN